MNLHEARESSETTRLIRHAKKAFPDFQPYAVNEMVECWIQIKPFSVERLWRNLNSSKT